ncbi:hypothetical protein KIN20_011104 [Parelaphostrongylus tenuis]|uniref:Uncharacterized protein n=1 Tax=Parelaphostrongylus tenuis TaxID=148309 RepID=A0AAD5MAJ0_PARTN|nr:hypothetical protein KIN20_011104 [Parelaphostrongylus tenuis]
MDKIKGYQFTRLPQVTPARSVDGVSIHGHEHTLVDEQMHRKPWKNFNFGGKDKRNRSLQQQEKSQMTLFSGILEIALSSSPLCEQINCFYVNFLITMTKTANGKLTKRLNGKPKFVTKSGERKAL